MTPDRALRFLEEGNARFTSNLRANRDLLQQVVATREGQWPFAVILSCIDSRVSAELIFDQGLGDVFSVRIAGNFVNDDILGSLEFGCKIAGAKLIVVLGHSHCGAIKGACDGVELGHLTKMLGKLEPALSVVRGKGVGEVCDSSDREFVQAVALENVRLTVARIFDKSSVLREMHEAGEIGIVGGMYDVEGGGVDFIQVPESVVVRT